VVPEPLVVLAGTDVLGDAAAVSGAAFPAAAAGGWTYFGAHSTQPTNSLTPAKPSSTQPAPATSSQPAAQPIPAAAPATNTAVENGAAASDKAASAEPDKAVSDEDTANASPSPKKTTNSDSSSASKAASDQPAAAPLVVKGGSVPAKPEAPADAPAPSVMGIATPGSSGPLPDLGGSDAPKPVLQRLNISQGVSQGLLIKKVAPVYPATALHLRIEGSVQLLATISAEGNITDVKTLSGDQQLTRAATDAVKQWKYKPYLLNGEPVEIQTQITINFSLPH